MLVYTLIRSGRKSLSLQIGVGGELIARAPRRMPVFIIEIFIRAKAAWIEKHQTIKKEISRKRKIYTIGEIQEMKKTLIEYLSLRVEYLWMGKGLPRYTGLKVTKSESRWGSCSAKNSLCFSYRLFEYLEKDPIFIDAIIYHELAHLKEKNHGRGFWSLVTSMIPEYETIMNDARKEI